MSGLDNIAHRFVSQPQLYNALQKAMGLEKTQRRLRPFLAEMAHCSVLDVGAGTGLYRSLLPASARYFWLDNDVEKLRGFQIKGPTATAILGDATQISLKAKSVDYALCVAMTHHLSDVQLFRLITELSRVVQNKIILLDALQHEARLSRWLWMYDRGSHPRSAHTLIAAIEAAFEIVEVEYYSIYHHYMLLVATPRHTPHTPPENRSFPGPGDRLRK